VKKLGLNFNNAVKEKNLMHLNVKVIIYLCFRITYGVQFLFV